MRMRRVVATVALVLAAVIGGAAVSTAPASASASSGYIHGVDSWADDWWDEGVISSTQYTHCNATAMWQAILWADGRLSYSGIDCWFGSTTTSATEAWQSTHGLVDDGLVSHDDPTRVRDSKRPETKLAPPPPSVRLVLIPHRNQYGSSTSKDPTSPPGQSHRMPDNGDAPRPTTYCGRSYGKRPALGRPTRLHGCRRLLAARRAWPLWRPTR